MLREILQDLSVLFRAGERWRLVVAVVAGLLIAILEALAVVMVAPLVQLMSNRDLSAGYVKIAAETLSITNVATMVTLLLVVVVGGFIIKDLCVIGFNWWMTGFVTRARLKTQHEVVDYYLHRPYIDHSNIGLSFVLRRTFTAVEHAYGWAVALLMAMTQLLSLIAVIGVLLLAAPGIAAGLLLFMALCVLLVQRRLSTINARLAREQLDASEETYNVLFDSFGAIKELQMRNAHRHFMNLLSAPLQKAAFAARDKQFISQLPKQLLEILFMVGLSLVFTIFSLLAGVEDILPSLALLIAGAFRILPTAAALLGANVTMRQSQVGLKECVEDRQLALQADRQRSGTARASEGERVPLRHELILEDIHYQYDPHSPEVLSGVSVRIPQGSSVAFVGTSGSGKTTMLDIIMGLLVPTEGRLLADGVDVSQSLAAWRKNVGVVPQEIFMTDRSVAENVAFDVASQDIDRERVRRVLEQAEILDYIEEKPDGIDTVFGERGKRLSGGQRQRVGIARALYRDPSILILDEATSALDNETENRIASTVAQLHGSVTVITVAHRLSTVRDADLIVFLDKGRVAATGNFDELLHTSEDFRRLVALGSLSAEPQR